MAIRYREIYGTWQVYYRDPATKKIVSRSYKTEDEANKENARIAYLLKYEPEYFQKTETVNEEKNEAPASPTLASLFLDYLKEKKFSKKVTGWQLSVLRPILAQYGELPLTDINEDTLADIVSFVTSDTSVRQATHNGRLRRFRTLVYYGIRRKLIPRVTFPKIPSAHYERFVPPSTEEISALYQAAAPHIQRVIIIGAYTGARVGECELLQLTWADVDLERRILRIHGSKKNANAQYREVPIRESLVQIFEQWQAEDLATGTQYLISYDGKPILSIKTAWKATLRRSGITRRIRPYDLRHAFGTELIAAGVDVGTVAKLMGHSNPAMLLNHYQYVMDRQKREAVENLPSPPVCRD